LEVDSEVDEGLRVQTWREIWLKSSM
jgi:hypothetical protein